MARFPPELVGHIFCMLRMPQDTEALCACTLVCSTWLAIAREYLYSVLRISDAEPGESRKLSRFYNVLRASPDIGHAVKRLVIAGSFTGSRLPLLDLLSVLSRLPRLRHLHLHHWRISHLGSAELSQHAPLVLQTLELKSIGFFLDAPANIFRLLNLFSPTCSLTLSKVSFRYTYGSRYADIVPTLPLPHSLFPSSLALHDADDRAQLLLEALVQTALPASLNHLHMSFYDFTPLLPTLERFFDSCYLRSLTLDFARCFPYAFWSDKSGLAEARYAAAKHLLPALQRMHLETFELRTAPVPPAPGPYWDLCLDILAALPDSLRGLRVYMADEHVGRDGTALKRGLRRYENLEIFEIRALPEDVEKTLVGYDVSAETFSARRYSLTSPGGVR